VSPGIPLDGTVQQPARADRASGASIQWIRKAYELSDSSARLASMEGLRGLAVMLVFFIHFHVLFGPYVKHTPLLWRVSSFLGNIGNSGVDLFFVLSGYLIYSGLVRHKVTFSRFLARRVARIYPTFLAIFVLYLALSVLFPQNSKLHGYRPAPLAVYLTQNLLLLPGVFPIIPIITVSWSLSYEAAFYVSAAALIHGMRLWNWAPVARVTLLTVILVSYVALCFSMHQAHVRMMMFMVGILLYEALASPRFRRLLSGPREVLVIVAFALCLAYSYLLDIRPDLFSSLPGWSAGRSVLAGVPGYQGPYKTIALSLTMFWFVGYCFAYDGRLMRIFVVAPLR
jgi:peptidoglycan/LPS O-acetylase OafA/YrhL